MKTLYKIIVPAVFFLGVSARAQVTLNTFGNVLDGNTVFNNSWESTGSGNSLTPASGIAQNGGAFDVKGTGVTNSDLSWMDIGSLANFSIGSNTAFSVTAQALSGNASSSFVVVLFDTNGNTASSTFLASSFPTGSYSTATVNFTTIGAFQPNSLEFVRISGGQAGGSSQFAFSFDNLTAVPEPSTYAAIFGIACFGAVMVKRQKRRAAIVA